MYGPAKAMAAANAAHIAAFLYSFPMKNIQEQILLP